MRFGRIGRKLGLAVLPLLALGAMPPIAAAGSSVMNLVVNVTPPQVAEGKSFLVSATFSDTQASMWTCTVAFGDGTSWQARITQPICTTPPHQPTAFGMLTGSVTIENGVGGPAVAQFTVITANTPPTLVDPQVYPARAGDPTSAAVGISDPGSAGESYVCSIDWGDGTPIQTGSVQGASAWPDGLPHCFFMGTHAYGAAGRYAVTMRALDQGGLAGTTTVNVDVVSAPTSIGLDPIADQTVRAVQAPWHLATTMNVSDPGNWPLSWSVDWGDGSSDTGSVGVSGPVTLQHDYAAAGTYGATANVSGGGVAVHQHFTVTAVAETQQNKPPVVTSTVTPAQAVEPDAVVASATFTDPDSTSWTCTINYGDNTFVDGVVSGNSCTGPAHHYAATGTYVGFVGITDNQGQSGAWMFTVSYTNRAPWVGGLGLVGDHRVGRLGHATAAVIDPGASFEAYTCTSIDYGDGSPLQAGTWVPTGWPDDLPRCVFPDHSYATAGTYMLTAVVTDGGGASGTASFQETIEAAGIVLTPPADQVVHSGDDPSTAGFHAFPLGSFTDDASSGPWSIAVDWGDGTSSYDQTTTSGELPKLWHSYGSGGQFQATVTVADSIGGQASAGFHVTYVVDPPTVIGLTSAAVVEEGTPFTFEWYVVDAIPAPYAVHVDWKDGTTTDTVADDPYIVLSHVYGASDPVDTYSTGTVYLPTLTATNGKGAAGSADNTTFVQDVAPAIVAPAGVLIAEGTQQTLTLATFSDASVAPWTVLIDLGFGSGETRTFQTPGPITIDYDSMYGDSTFHIVVLDRTGMYSEAYVPVSVENVAPTVSADQTSLPEVSVGSESSTASFSFVDPGWRDAETYGCSVDFGDGSTAEGTVAGVNCLAPGHVYGTAGTFHIVATVTDSRGGSGSASATIVVSPAHISLGIPAFQQPAVEGSPVVAAATIEPSAAPDYVCSVDYGDGSGPQAGLLDGGLCTGAPHTYGRPGTFEVSVGVSNGADVNERTSAALTVDNVSPVATPPVLPAAAKFGTKVTASASFADPGTSESYQLRWDWGDGSPVVQFSAEPGTFTLTHIYRTPGVYAVGYTVDDGTSMTGSDSASIGIFDPARKLSGQGTVLSPVGACPLPQCAQPSTATFSVSASYAKNATVPTASVKFRVAGLSFASTSADWFVVADGSASVQGKGTINGVTGYTFRIRAWDARPDRFSIEIYDSSGIFYGNGWNSPLTSGSISVK